MGLSLSLKQSHEGRIREVPEENHCSSMYSNIVHLRLISYARVIVTPSPGNMICNTYSIRQKKRAFFENYSVFQIQANESP
jgi:hypothetical protein